ncbi:MAG: MogA/MoaB family molybdenum cofactor biosynthesis protein [Nitrospirales bacterium]|nr:MogA/MoaB family molybdenum cofactor biosynthesis protein [Nitrospira sp.]MDR4502550.1 MogA/MoaB family molybdenum cofactor biosynthesis protein [Nitrospirales bacterium]
MISAAILVISSKVLDNGQRDEIREVLEPMFQEEHMRLSSYHVVADNRDDIKSNLIELCDEKGAQIVLTVGGTGVRPTDWAPEATKDVIDKEVPGIGEAMRAESLKKVRTAMLSRGIAGIRGSTLIVNLPGSSRGARENLSVLMPILNHTIGKISGKGKLSRKGKLSK